MILGGALLGAGVGLSLLLIGIDLRAMRSTEPYSGIGRLAPEFHVFTALLSGAGAWIAWGWIAGVGAFVGQIALCLLVSFKMRTT